MSFTMGRPVALLLSDIRIKYMRTSTAVVMFRLSWIGFRGSFLTVLDNGLFAQRMEQFTNQQPEDVPEAPAEVGY